VNENPLETSPSSFLPSLQAVLFFINNLSSHSDPKKCSKLKKHISKYIKKRILQSNITHGVVHK
jgi:hypothetical protein